METKNLMMVMAALALAGCSQNEVTEVNPDAHPVIGFDVYTGVQTRGAETDITALKGKDAGFGFFAYKTEGEWKNDGSKATPDFLYNEHGTWRTTEDTGDNGSWGYEHTRFWPTNEDKISFFAYAPYADNQSDGENKGITLSAQTKTGEPTLEFALPTSDKWKDMVDLVTDCRDNIKNQTAASNEGNKGTVSFKFSHVLTKVADIKVKPDQKLGDDIRIYVTELKLLPGTDKLPNKAKYKFSDDEWENLSTPSYFSNEQDLSDFLNKATNVNWCGYTTSSVDVSNNTAATSLFPSEQALYFIPVNNDKGTAEGDLKLKITYDIVTKVDDNKSVTSTTVKEVELPAGTFKKGTAHTYTLTIKLNTINIAVDESAINWGEPENKENEEGMEA